MRFGGRAVSYSMPRGGCHFEASPLAPRGSDAALGFTRGLPPFRVRLLAACVVSPRQALSVRACQA